MPVIVFVALASLGALFMVVFLTEVSRPPAHRENRQGYGTSIASYNPRALSGRSVAARGNPGASIRTVRMELVTPRANVARRAATVQAVSRLEARQ